MAKFKSLGPTPNQNREDLSKDMEESMIPKNIRMERRSTLISKPVHLHKSDEEVEDYAPPRQSKLIHHKTAFCKKTQDKANRTLRWLNETDVSQRTDESESQSSNKRQKSDRLSLGPQKDKKRRVPTDGL